MTKEKYLLGFTRLGLGWIFLWAYLDKTFGLGFATPSGKSWLDGASPTLGFLKSGTYGPFADLAHNLAGSPAVDWLFMLGMLLTGLALIFGIGTTVACYSGSMMMLFIWLTILPPKQNPFLDEHIIYILALMLINHTKAGHYLGFGRWWAGTPLVKKFPLLR